MDSHNSSTIKHYERNINNVINYITDNITRPLSLEELSQAACFSKYHFHRIFKALVGETVNDFRRRLQLEKAAHMLVFNRGLSITHIALECGFSSSQNFSKAFKLHNNVTPGQFRKERAIGKGINDSKIGNILSNPGKDIQHALHYNAIINGNEDDRFTIDRRMDMTDKVVVKELPEMTVAYVRQIGEYTHDMLYPLYGKLLTWAGARQLIAPDNPTFGVCWDFVAVTPEEKCRYDACIEIPAGYETGSEVSTQILAHGLFACYRSEVKQDTFYKAWNHLFRDWLPASGYAAADRPCYEIMHNLTSTVPLKSYTIEICLPVTPL